jgi:hypothetical protein
MKKAQNGVQAAIDAQKKKRDAIQAKADARKESAMAPRRAAGLPASPKKSQQVATINSKPSKATQDYRRYSEREIDNYTPTSREPEKRKSAGSSARKVTRTAAATISLPKREMSSLIQERKSPIKTSGIQKGSEKREFSKTESKIVGEIQKMKSGKNTEVSQARIKALQDKKRAEKMKAERKDNRAENKSKRIEKRAAVKAVKKSYK